MIFGDQVSQAAERAKAKVLPKQADDGSFLKGLIQPSSKREEAIMSGVGADAPDTSGLSQSDAAMGFSGGGVRQALSNRASKYFNQDVNRIRQEAKLQASSQGLQDSNAAQGYLMGRQKLEMAKYNREKERERANQAARAQAITSILGVAGTVGGAMIGGPPGAMAGSAIGQGLGPKASSAPFGPSQGGEFSAGLNPGQGLA